MRKPMGALLGCVLLVRLATAAEPFERATPLSPQPTLVVDDTMLAPGEIAPDGLSSGPRLFLGAEYLTWWLREGRIPATVTTSSQASQGLLGKPDTQTLYGDNRLETRHGDRFVGVRGSIAYWFDEDQSFGFEGGAFFLERDSTYFKAISDGGTLLARVFVNPDGTPSSKIIAGQTPNGVLSGGFVGYSRIELFGEEANLVAPLLRGESSRLELLGGVRFLQMRDRTDLTSSSRLLPDLSTLLGLEDHYRIHNAYYGGQVGLRGETTFGRWSLSLRGEIGLGANQEQIRAFGQSIYQTPLERLVTQTGLTVQASNMGTFDRTALNMVTEMGLNLGYRLTRHIEIFGGYTFLLWDSPLRSGDQIDAVINTNPGTAPARPGIPFKEDLFWAQGLNAGLNFSW